MINYNKAILITEKHKKKQFKKNLRLLKYNIKKACKAGEFKTRIYCPVDDVDTFVKILEKQGFIVTTRDCCYDNEKALEISWGLVNHGDKNS